jgi:hypothetical protein
MMIRVIAVMQLVAPPGDLDGVQRHDRDVVAVTKAFSAWVGREAAAIRIPA